MELIKTAIKVIEEKNVEGNDDSFFVFNPEDVKIKYEYWIKKLPKIKPYYAVKCNGTSKILRILRDLGAGFDCASKNEISGILDLDVEPSGIIYAHTAKVPSHLKFAAENGVQKLTFDSLNELLKIRNFHPSAKVILRIKFDSTKPLVKMGTKFGCDPGTEAPILIKSCRDMGMNLIGIAFHVGSGTNDYSVYERAFDVIRDLFDYAASIGIIMNFVDIGGGFYGYDLKRFDQCVNFINRGIERNNFSDNVEIIAEPGRYFVDSAFVLVTLVTSKRKLKDGTIHYYINDSIHLSFTIAVQFNQDLETSVIRKSKLDLEPKEAISTIWGCTCNPLDRIICEKRMPEFDEGDWLVFHNMGAYTTVATSEFNGFSKREIYFMIN